MKMWKVATVVTLLLSPMAFGMTMTATPAAVGAAPGETVAVTLAIDIPAGEKIYGIDVYPMPDLSLVSLVGRQTLHSQIKDAAILDASSAGQPLDGSVNLGAIVDAATYTAGGATASGNFMTFTFRVDPQAAMDSVISVVFNGGYATMAGGYVEHTPTTAITVTPEPVSALLLAVGAAFFARRRRA